MFSFGWKMLASGLLDTVYNDVRQLVIGKMYTSSDLAYYNQGQKYTQFIVVNIDSSIDSILLPVMSAAQERTEIVKAMTRRAIKTSTYIIMPMMMGLAVCAEPLVNLLLTSKWLPCIPYMRIFCFTYAFYPIHTANLNAIKAMGRSDLFLKLEIVKKLMGTIVLVATIWYGPLLMAYSLLFTSILSQIINSWPNKKLLNYSYFEQLRDMLPQIFLSCIMGIIVWSISLLNLSCLKMLIIQIPLGILVYVCGSRIVRMESYFYLVSIISSFYRKKK